MTPAFAGILLKDAPGLRRVLHKDAPGLHHCICWEAKAATGKDPVEVRLLDPLDLPCPLPLLHLELALARFLQLIMDFVPDQQFAAVPLGEARNQTFTWA